MGKKQFKVQSSKFKDGNEILKQVQDDKVHPLIPLQRGNEEEKEPNYWRSFAELYDDPQFIEAQKHEFAKGVSEAPNVSKLSGLSRRKFLALLGASAALAAAGCSNYRNKGEVVPYNKKPEEVILGIPNYYASTCTGCNNACGILIKTREGRPIKVDGNPDHPVNKGKICAKGQASTLNMYDPDRLREPLQKGNAISWQDADDRIINELKSASSSGKSIAIVTNTILSPTQKKLFDDFQSTYPTTRIYSCEVGHDVHNNTPMIKWDEANVILALESDFLGSEGNVIEQTRLFSQNRDVMNGKEFNKLYAVEGGYTLTGMNADYRIRLRTDAIEEFVMCLLNEFVVRRKIGTSTAGAVLSGYSLDEFKGKYSLPESTVKYLVDDLLKNQGGAIVIAGSKLPESTHNAVNMLNDVLGNSNPRLNPAGTGLYLQDSSVEIFPLSTKAELDGLMYDMKSGKTGVVIHYGTNPVFGLPSDYSYADALSKVPMVITMTELKNETSEVSHYVLPVNHCFESWGDYKTRTGFLSLQQPVIAPIFNTRQKEAIMLTWQRGDKNAYSDKIYRDYLISNWEKSVYPMVNQLTVFKNFWQASLHDGVAFVSEKPVSSPLPSSKGELGAGMKASKDFVVLLQDNGAVGADGRFANNGWLQELPHPVSKIVWDNYAAVSLQTSIDLGVKTNDKVEIKIGNKSAEVPVYVQPGLADNVIELQLGYGRKTAGTIGSGIGHDVNKLIHAEPQLTSTFYNNAIVTKVPGTYELVSTIEHYLIEQTPLLKDVQFKRNIIQEGTYQEYKKNPQFLQKKIAAERAVNEFPSISQEHEYKNVKWGMAIDLNKCTGCSACIIACTAENNVPVVGKDQVAKNREMLWLRIDRYYSGTPEAPKANFQPMLCQHCDFAPCENVCPVVATTHSPDGLNQMTYNRCVGTRYCSNNCPYKVRRFNYFNFRDRVADQFYMQEPIDLLHNPEVTVRSRGVMEKCTFCVQRIMNEKQKATEEHRHVKGSNVTTACQDACPANAIVFGDINEEGSEIAKQREHELGYNVLDDLKVRPNVTYVAKLRNVIEKS
jgi:MoCo/4Fe-4S cofactor protein with predicted Tat translocation signal